MCSLNKLPSRLFWDIKRPSSEDEWERYYAFVVQRVLQYGSIADFMVIREYYGDEKIKSVFRSARSLHPRIQAFGLALFGEEAKNQACSPIPSHQKLWPY